MKRYFHATQIPNVTPILNEGLKPMFGEIYMADSEDSAVKWMGFRMAGKPFAVIEVELNEKKVTLGGDHSPIMQEIFKCGDSFVYEKVIPPSKIKNINYFQQLQKPQHQSFCL